MHMVESRNGSELTVALEGRLDTMTSPEVEASLKKAVSSDVTTLVLDFSKLEYLSSAGLRVLLAMHKHLTATGAKMVIKHVNASVMEILSMTGFLQVLSIEKNA